MKQFLSFSSLFLFAFLIFSCDSSPEGFSNDASMNEKVEKLLAQMTLEEKVGQMNQYSGFYDPTGPAPDWEDGKIKYEHLRKGWVGSMLNVKNAKEVSELQRIAVEETRLGIPIIFGLDVVHGHKTISPIPLAEAASWDLEAIEKSARVGAIEATASGISWTFAPMVDIYRDARWGRVMEGAGEDPYLGSKIGAARVRGFQGDDLSDPTTMAATAKHFAGYGFVEAAKEYNTVELGKSTLYNIVFPPFQACIDEGVKSVMNAFNTIDNIPATGNINLQRDILKGKWNFNGFVISDWGSTFEMIDWGYAEDLEDAAKKAAIAGSDMDMESDAYVTHLVQLVKNGEVNENIVDEAVRRILTVKFELGLFEDPYRYGNVEREKELLYHDDHLEAALDMAKKSIVLLKNEGNLLPLNKSQKKIAVIGELANDKTSPLGSWRVSSDDETAISVLEGLNHLSIPYTYEKGPKFIDGPIGFVIPMSINTSNRNGIKEAVQLAKKSDVVIMVLGEHGYQSGEGRSRTELGLPGLQQELLEEVYKVKKDIILVLNNGRPLVLNWADKHIPAILEAWQLGTRAGDAIAQTIFGDHVPSGKLPMSFPRAVGQCPIYYNQMNTGRPGFTGNVFWSSYTDIDKTPLYPFGYGLSYTSFNYKNLTINASNPSSVEVSVDITNTGNYSGEEVVQLYIRDRSASVARPVKELKGFEKILLEAGEQKTITFVLTEKELGFYNNNGTFLVEPGMFDIMVGTNSVEGLKDEFELKL